MKKRNLTHENQFNGMPVLQYTNQEIGLDTNILHCIHDRMEDMLSRHSKVFAMRLDVRKPDSVQDEKNEWFSQYQAHFIKKEKRAGYDPAYIAVREVSENGKVHYHEYLMVNGNKTQNIHNHIENANSVMNTMQGLNPGEHSGLIDDCTHDRNGNPQVNGEMINPKTWEGQCAQQASFRHASYLAKDVQKNTPKGTRELFASQIKKETP